jgi:hypothetical protein
MERVSKEEWDALEPRLAAAERVAHDTFMNSADTRQLLPGPEFTPGYLLLQRLKEAGDQEGIRLFRAMEMYHHELTRADISAAFLYGKSVGNSKTAAPESQE